MNPFDDVNVTEPRRIVDTDATINSAALARLLEASRLLEKQELPRLTMTHDVMLVASPDPGYGKSHLIGRIFQELSGHATLVYLRPFGSPDSCWQDLLNRLVRELEYPDRADAIACSPGEPTQLDGIVRSTFGQLLARLLREKRLKSTNLEEDLKAFDQNPVAELGREHLRKWFEAEMEVVTNLFDKELQRCGVELQPSRRAWIQVLIRYMTAPAQGPLRQFCRDWISAKPLAEDDWITLGLKIGDNVEPDLSMESRNERCFERLRDLCLISSFFRPFLFCFDQTELYNRSEALARTFGMVLSRLRREVVNHVTLVTANERVWDKRVYPHFEEADQQCIAPRISLAGVTQEQALNVIKNRLDRSGVAAERQQSFLVSLRLADLYQGIRERSLRDVLRKCAANWTVVPVPLPSLDALFEAYRLEVMAKPRGLDFDPGVFQRVLHEVFQAHPKARSEAFKSNKGYLSLKWNASEPKLLFALEEGASYMRWQAIIREARRYHEQAKKSGARLRAIALRTSELRHFGPKTQAEARAAEKDGVLKIVTLNKLETAEFYAANELFAAAGQGDIEGYSIEDALNYLRSKMNHWVQRFSQEDKGTIPVPVRLPPSRKLSDALVGIVRSSGLLPWPVLETRLTNQGLKATREEALMACANMGDRITVFSSPTNSVFKWIK